MTQLKNCSLALNNNHSLIPMLPIICPVIPDMCFTEIKGQPNNKKHQFKLIRNNRKQYNKPFSVTNVM
jgi:hypothetical protein